MAYNYPNVPVSGNSTIGDYQKKGLTGVITDILAAALAATAAPTAAATAASSGTGGLLAAGTYYFVFTEGNGLGQTTVSPEGLQLTVTTGQKPVFTFPTLKTGNSERFLYLGAVNGSSGGPYTLYASGITTTTYTAAIAAPTNSFAAAPPTTNTTGLSAESQVLARNVFNHRFDATYQFGHDVSVDFLSGKAVDFTETMRHIKNVHFAARMLERACSEIGTAIDANPGTLGLSGIVGNLFPNPQRTWP